MRSVALWVLSLSSGLLLVVQLIGGSGASGILFGAVAVVFPVALMALGAHRPGSGRGPVLALLALAALLLGGFFGMWAWRGQVEDGPWLAGLPVAATIFLVALWLAPLVLVSWAYARGFPGQGLDDEALERLRRTRRDP